MTKPRLKYADVFRGIDFEHMTHGTKLDLDGSSVTFEGWHHGSIWISDGKRVYFVRRTEPLISRLRLI